MQARIIDESSSWTSGIHFRRSQDGPEQELVDWFIGKLPVETPRGCRTTVFREPRLESGFPDLVVVFWRPETAQKWVEPRRDLTTRDIRVLHHLATSGPARVEDLRLVFPSWITKSLQRLELAETIRRVGKKYAARSMSRLFAVERIVAFEAKVRGWSEVLAQATLNTWFASHSFILIPDCPRVSDFAKSAIDRGVGVWTREDGCVSEPVSNLSRLPLSYASWLFNEWVWRIDSAGVSSCPLTSLG